jgi:hypothetical protein
MWLKCGYILAMYFGLVEVELNDQRGAATLGNLPVLCDAPNDVGVDLTISLPLQQVRSV